MPAAKRIQEMSLEEVLRDALADALAPPVEEGPDLFVHTADGRTLRRPSPGPPGPP